jgi:hypothetical protein
MLISGGMLLNGIICSTFAAFASGGRGAGHGASEPPQIMVNNAPLIVFMDIYSSLLYCESYAVYKARQFRKP